MTERGAFLRAQGATAGFSTITAIVYLTLAGLLLTPLVATIVSAQRGFVETREEVRAAGSVRFAHLTLTRHIRMAGSHPLGPRIGGIEPDPDGDGVFDDIRILADYNPPDGDVGDPGEYLRFWVGADTLFVRSGPGEAAEPYLVGVDSLAFEYFDRDGAVITDPARVPDRAVAVQVTMRGRGRGVLANDAKLELVGRVRLRNGG